MESKNPVYFQDVQQCVDDIIEKVGKEIVFGMPLALGKSISVINELYKRVKEDPEMNLTIVTALSLEKPIPGSDIERRLMEPIFEKLFGDYPDFDYMLDLRKNRLPPNFKLVEFYNKSGGYLSDPHPQQYYISSNYTHVPRDIANQGINVAGQLLAKGEVNGRTMFSMSCNPDTAIEVGMRLRERIDKGEKGYIVGQVNSNLPFMYGDAVTEPSIYDAILEGPDFDFQLFSTPKNPVMTDDYMIGLYASSLIQDGGTLQIGIGALGDAIAAGLQMRQVNNDVYCQALKEIGAFDNFGDVIAKTGGTESLEEGLYGSSEMLVDGFINLYDCGVIKRKVYDSIPLQRLINEKRIQERVTPETLVALLNDRVVCERLTEQDFAFLQKYGIFKEGLTYDGGLISDGQQQFSADLSDKDNLAQISANCLGTRLKGGMVMHGSFFIGPNSFYKALNKMSEDERRLFNMTSVQYVNHLYGGEELKTLQRQKARFINAGMKLNLLGAVASDALDDGRVVSGVGGQYNFVSMAHALEGARSILMIKTTRQKAGKVSSNVLYKYGHTTIPRHLRDIVVTEYGIADLRSKCDCEVIAAILNITDSRFQEELLQEAKKNKKIAADYQIPEQFKNNYPAKLEKQLAAFKEQGYFNPFPFGTEMTPEELVLGASLKKMKADLSAKKISIPNLCKALVSVPEATKPYLQRMQLVNPGSIKEKISQRVTAYALLNSGRL